MRKTATVLLALCASLTAWAIEMPKAGPQYMPEVMEPIVAPFDVSGIHKPEFASRSVTVKMKKKGLSTMVLQQAIDKMSQKGGGTVVIPNGQWTSGRITLKTGVRLHLSDGAVLRFSGDIKDYQPAVLTRNEGYDVMSLGAMIYANGAENIGITGRGHIVGPSTECEMYVKNRDYLVVEQCVDITKPIAERLCDGQDGRPVLLPMMIAPVNCKNILLEGVTIDQGLFWNIVPQYCDNVIIRGVTVNSAGHGRTDGIDIESTTNSLIEYCSLDCGDDCYTIKSGRGEDGVKTGRPSVNVVIRHSVALRGGGGLVLGTETAANMYNIYMHDCIFDGTEQGIRIKTRRPRGGGGHDVWVERVHAKNIKWNAFTVEMLGSKKWVGDLANRYPAREVNMLTPEFKNIYVKDFTVDGCSRFIDVKALPERPLTNVLIENADVSCKDFMRMQDADGFVLHNATVRTSKPTAVLDGCRSVMLLDVDFRGKKLQIQKKNATIWAPQQPADARASFGLKDAYKDYFTIGVSLNQRNVSDDAQKALVLKEFNSVTAENDMKPGELHPKEGVWNWERADKIANFCRKNGIKMRGHCLCWHAQFADWMFTDKNGNEVKKEVFYERLREHIHTVVNRYKDVVYCWDVVNEAIADDEQAQPGQEPCPYRQSRHFMLCGDEFIAKAFEFAREADPSATLIYNDYSTVSPGKRERIYNMVKKMKDAGVPIDGIGMQGHYNIYYPDADLLDQAITRFKQLVNHIHITELDLRMNSESGGQLMFSHGEAKPQSEHMQQQQSEQYGRIFSVLRKHADVIDNVTFWNLSDRDSWLGVNNHALPFDEQYRPKPCYHAICDFTF